MAWVRRSETGRDITQGFVEERTATYNRLRGLIAEFGIVLPQKVACLRRSIGAHLEDIPGFANRCIGDLLSHADQLDARIAEYAPKEIPLYVVS